MSDSGTALVDDLVARLQGATPDERVPLVDEAYRSTEGMAWIPNPGPQTDAYWSEADILLYGGQAAGGKGLRPDAPVLTPFGWREIGSLKVGDAVCAVDGTVSRVIARFDRGVQPLYLITFSDGCSIECDADHIWLVWGGGKVGPVGARKYTTAEIASDYARGGQGHLSIPTVDEAARFSVEGKWLPIEGRAISSIVPAGEGETICIAVSHPSSLFITKDFIVTHNTDLLAGLALTQHRRSLLMRRQYTDLGYLIERVREVDGSWTGFNGSPPPRLRTLDKRLIDFGAALNLGDEEHWQGHPHDFIGFDEVVHFLEAQVRFLMGWNRSAVQGQRSRVVMASNPPANPDGDWIIGMFAPWLDQNHQLYGQVNPGELVWYVTDPDGRDFITPGPEPYHFPGDKTPAGEDRWLTPRSRTFVPASLEDNIFQRGTGYESQLDNLPEPLRSILRDGNFMLAREDDPWQLIPTSWIQEAQDRWRPQRPEGVAMTAMALDPTGGGSDSCAIARRYDGWFSEIISVPGYEIKDEEMAGLVVQHRRDNCVVVIDMGGGYGGVPYMMLQDNLGDNGGVEDLVYAYKGAEGSTARDESRKMAFENKRTESWWRFREALNPGREGGSGVSLPPDQTLLSDLASVKFTTKAKAGVLTIVAEKKVDVVKRLGRSPDHGDAVVMCWTKGGATVTGQRLVPRDQRVGARNGGPKAITSRDRNTGSRRRR